MNQQQPVRLNIGAGDTTIPGFIPIDIKTGTNALKLPYGDGSVDEIYASHVLEHFDYYESLQALEEWKRVLRPGGRLRIAVPDARKALASTGTDPLWEHRIMGGHIDEHDFHKTVWFDEKLRLMMRRVGFMAIRPWDAEFEDSSQHPCTTRFEGIKPALSDSTATHYERIPSDGTPIRLNIGAGDTTIPGFIAIDQKFGHDACALPFKSGSVEEIYSSHCLEHIHHSKIPVALSEWVRVLKPGGRIRIAIPDFEKVEALRRSDPETYTSNFMSVWLHGTHDLDTDRHQAFIGKADLVAHLRARGIEEIGEWKGEYGDQAQTNAMTLNIGGYKRKVEIPRHPSVVMVLSTPRFGPVDTFKSIADACQSIGWKFQHWGGTEWGKGLEQVIGMVLDRDKPDYIFVLDYDSVFDPKDCLAMLDFMQRNPEVAAAWPAEAHRHLDFPLGMAPQAAAANLYDFSGEFTRMWSGHFGCTIIRSQVFRTIPHPWFWSVPNPTTGDWSTGSDADLTCWRSMLNYGFQFGQVNGVVIGHLEWCVKWPTKTGIAWQPIQNYRAQGKPKEAVFDSAVWVAKAKKMHGSSEPEPTAKSNGHVNGHAAKVPVRTEGRIPASDPGDEDRLISTGIANEYQKRLDAMGISGPDPLIKHET